MSRYAGVDRDRVLEELERYVEETAPRPNPDPHLSSYDHPACGDDRAVELTERVLPILDRLYLHWREQNPASMYYEYRHVREACKRLRAQILHDDDVSAMLGGDASPRLAANELHHLVWTAASAQWATDHRHDAVLAAAKAVNSMLQQKLGQRDHSEVRLVQEAFSKNHPEPGKPRLRFPTIADAQTRESIRQGAMNFGSGCFQAIRNPLGHLLEEENELTEQEALERLAALSLLARWIDQAERVSSPEDGS